MKGIERRSEFAGTGYLPPQDIELEKAVLGAILLETPTIVRVASVLKVDTFYKEAHQIIYKAAFSLYQKGNPIDLLTVSQKLRDEGNLEKAGGAYYITELTSSVNSTSHIDYHAQILTELSMKRKQILTGFELQKRGFSNIDDCFDTITYMQNQLLEMLSSVDNGKMRLLKDGLKAVLQNIEQKLNQPSGLTGVPTGLLAVNHITGGWQSPDLIILAARPGMGKTSLALRYAVGAAITGNQVAFFSLEMSEPQLITRLLSMETKIAGIQDLTRGRISKDQLGQLVKDSGKLHNYNIHIDDTAGINISQLRSKCFRLKQEHGIKLIVIDYLQLITADVKGNRESEISHISRSLKRLAKELDIPVIALAQLSRAVETRGGEKRPQLSDLRESGSIEQDADMVQFVYRPEYYGITVDSDGNSLKGAAEIIIAKHRNGACEDILVKFNAPYTDFQDYNIQDSTFEVDDNSDISRNRDLSWLED